MEYETWLLLEDAWPRNALQLGSLVRDCRNPALYCYFPGDLAGKQNQMVQRYEDYEATLEFAGHAKRSRLFKMIPKSDDSSDIVHLKARESCTYRLQNSWTWIETIGARADAREWPLRHFKEHHAIYLLPGLRTLRDGLLSRTDNSTTTGYSAGLPIPGS